MKVLHVITSLQTGGAEKLMVDLLPRLNVKGITAEIAVFSNQQTPFSRQLEDLGVKIHWLNKGRNPYNIINLFRLKRLANQYDVIHAHNSICQLYSALVSLGSHKNFITTEHSTSNRRRSMTFYYGIEKWMYSRFKKIICISSKAEETLRDYIKLFDSPRIITINNGIDIKHFQDAMPNFEIVKSLPVGAQIITMVGSLRDAKDQDTIIKALSLLPDKFHLLIVGEGPRMNILKELTSKLNVDDRVHFLGVRSDIPEILKASNYAVMSSHWEGLSLSSVEGMSVGIPLIASDVDGLREVVDGAGILFSHGDYKQLASQIMFLYSNSQEYKRISNLCQLRASEFDISKTVSGYVKIYNSIPK